MSCEVGDVFRTTEENLFDESVRPSKFLKSWKSSDCIQFVIIRKDAEAYNPNDQSVIVAIMNLNNPREHGSTVFTQLTLNGDSRTQDLKAVEMSISSENILSQIKAVKKNVWLEFGEIRTCLKNKDKHGSGLVKEYDQYRNYVKIHHTETKVTCNVWLDYCWYKVNIPKFN